MELCKNGIHFCINIGDCFTHYAFDKTNKVAEVEAVGEIIRSDSDTMCCTDKLNVIRELSWDEVIALCNSGYRNSGNWNSGDCNSGDWNSGNCNSGDCNSGNWNSGDWNSGDWNSGNYNSGIFCTSIDPKILMFDKISCFTYRTWRESRACHVMRRYKPFCWIPKDNMTDEEKSIYPEHKTTGGFLRKNNIQDWWDSLEPDDRECVINLPGFNAGKFEQCTGIKL